MEKILIIGGGEIGQALAHLLIKKEPIVFDKDPTKSNADKPLLVLVAEAEIIFLALPTRVLLNVLIDIKDQLNDEKIIITLSKGVDTDGNFSFEIIADLGLSAKVVALGGPMLAEEILAGQVAGAVVASEDVEARQVVKNLFTESALKTSESGDLKGVVLAGVFKNIYTLGLSIGDALVLGDNSRGLLVASALAETAELVASFGGEASSAYSWAGLGDLVATSASTHSRNRTVGEQLVKDGKCCVESEGSLALPLLWPRLENKIAGLPFLAGIGEVVINNKNPKNVFEDIFLVL
ncbi:MAG: glycerol-3-phosphate dehydrogenase [Patescibacteria group bacterium]|nr:glycerol-3-phosphate dehydrogenase [Patescibacteria group bacterium]